MVEFLATVDNARKRSPNWRVDAHGANPVANTRHSFLRVALYNELTKVNSNITFVDTAQSSLTSTASRSASMQLDIDARNVLSVLRGLSFRYLLYRVVLTFSFFALFLCHYSHSTTVATPSSVTVWLP